MRKHIVIIEHDTDILEIMQRNLEKAGYVVTGFATFSSMAELAFMRPDCFIINEWLPQVSGHAICLMLKAKVQTSTIPVILISSTHPSEPATSLSDADALVKKSGNCKYLLSVISSLIANRQVSLSK